MAGVLCTHGSTVFSQFPSLDLVLQILSHVLIPWLGFCALFHLDFSCHCFDLFKMFLIPVLPILCIGSGVFGQLEMN